MKQITHEQIIDILVSISPHQKTKRNSISKQGREQNFKDHNFLKVFILMTLINMPSIKGTWKFLVINPEICKACGFTKLPDRSTFSRRLNKLEVKNWIGTEN